MLRKFFIDPLPKYGQLLLFTGSVGMFANSIKDDQLKNRLLKEMEKVVELQKNLDKKDLASRELILFPHVEKSLSTDEVASIGNNIENIDQSTKNLNNITNQFNNINSDSKVEVEKSTVEEIKNSVIEQIDNISKSNDVLKDIIEKKFNLGSDSNIS
jgi:small-conductance mechanosensitive channel